MNSQFLVVLLFAVLFGIAAPVVMSLAERSDRRRHA